MKRIKLPGGLTGWIIIGMIGGIAVGVLAPNVARELTPLNNIFLRGHSFCLQDRLTVPRSEALVDKSKSLPAKAGSP